MERQQNLRRYLSGASAYRRRENIRHVWRCEKMSQAESLFRILEYPLVLLSCSNLGDIKRLNARNIIPERFFRIPKIDGMLGIEPKLRRVSE